MKALPFILVLVSTPADAQSPLVETYRAPPDACVARAERSAEFDACRSLLSDACMAGEPQGQTTTGMAMCLQAELLFWDERLNAEYRATVANLRRIDESDRAYNPEYAVREERLRDAQRAWIVFRDADCAVDHALHGGGSMRSIMAPSCLARRTFDRVKDLIHLRELMH